MHRKNNLNMMSAFRIDGQRAVITGGGSGLGFGIAKVFIEAGAEVIIIGRNEEKLRGAQQQLGERCSYRAFDVTQILPYTDEDLRTTRGYRLCRPLSVVPCRQLRERRFPPCRCWSIRSILTNCVPSG